jgi:DNA-binding NtrC family response regulator
VVFHQGREIGLEDLPEEVRGAARGEPSSPLEEAQSAPRTMEEMERQAILAALRATGGRRKEAAERLQIGLRTLQRKIKEYRTAGYLE